MIKNVSDFLVLSALNFPNKIAVIEKEKSITFGKLYETSKAIGSELLKLGLRRQPVLIVLPKGINALACFLGTAISGNFYCIVDEKTPIDRLKSICDILKPKIIISDKQFDELYISVLQTDKFANLTADENLLKIAKQTQIDTDLCYVLFTSGSTGVPKGVAITHKSVIDYANWVSKTFGIISEDKFANQAPFYFDNSILDIYTALKVGCELHIIQNSLFAFPTKVIKYIHDNKISTIFWVPSVLIYFANTKTDLSLPHLKKVLFCGEIMPNKQLNVWRKALPNAIFANLYGPTEITDVCAYYICDRDFKDDEILPIGKACENMELLVFDENLNLITKPHIKGELYVRGTGLSVGYYGNPNKTNEAFIQNPLQKNYKENIYKTGDIVAYNEKMELLCYGRIDNQIKISGHRVELGEIEAIVGSLSDVKNTTCIFKDNKIFLFYEAEKDIDLNIFLKQKLPHYMLPTRIIRVDKFKLNQNGKIDRKALYEKI